VTLLGECTEIIVDQEERILMDLGVKAGEGFFEEPPGAIVGWTKTEKSHY
jgi:hypothetical protein